VRFHKLVLLLLICLFSTPLAQGMEYPSTEHLLAAFDSVGNPRPDFTEQAQVKQLVLERGGVRIVMASGILTFAEPVLGRRFAAVFVGEACCEIAPPTHVERQLLRSVARDSTVKWTMDKIVMVFSDRTEAELRSTLTFSSLNKKHGEDGILRDFRKEVPRQFGLDPTFDVLQALLQPTIRGNFAARVFDDRGEQIMFTYMPMADEEVSLYKRLYESYGAQYYWRLICSYSPPDRDTATATSFGPKYSNILDSLVYDFEIEINSAKNTSVDGKLTFISRMAGLSFVTLALASEFLDSGFSATDSTGSKSPILRVAGENVFTVFLTTPVDLDQKGEIEFHYTTKSCDALSRQWLWYPTFFMRTGARYVAKFTFPQRLHLMTVGNRLSDSVRDSLETSVWSSGDEELRALVFDVGDYVVDTMRTKNNVLVKLYTPRASFLSMLGASIRQGSTNRDAADSIPSTVNPILRTAVAALQFYDSLLSPYGEKELNLVEAAQWVSVGYQGYVRLSMADLVRGSAAHNAGLVAHELAHYWMGHLVPVRSYHDYWISEGGAEFLANRFVENYFQGDSVKSLAYLYETYRWNLDLRMGKKGKSGDLAEIARYPLWLGARLWMTNPYDYQRLVYSEGAYVFRMLRELLTDPQTHSDRQFLEFLHDVIELGSDSYVTTADLRALAERHYEDKLNWFFNQYVYSASIPHYDWFVESTSEGTDKHLIKVTVRTTSESPGFKMPVPFSVRLAGRREAIAILDIDTPLKTVTFYTREKPEDFVFDPYGEVLCTNKRSKRPIE
jgi:hypothetical protein